MRSTVLEHSPYFAPLSGTTAGRCTFGARWRGCDGSASSATVVAAASGVAPASSEWGNHACCVLDHEYSGGGRGAIDGLSGWPRFFAVSVQNCFSRCHAIPFFGLGDADDAGLMSAGSSLNGHVSVDGMLEEARPRCRREGRLLIESSASESLNRRGGFCNGEKAGGTFSQSMMEVAGSHAGGGGGGEAGGYQAAPAADAFGEAAFAPDEQQRIQDMLNSRARPRAPRRRARDREARS